MTVTINGTTGITTPDIDSVDATFTGTVSGAVPAAIDVNASAPADSLAIDASGNIGIGTTSPNQKLTIDSGALAFSGNTSTPTTSAGIHRPATDALALVTDSTERMRLESTGRVGVNLTSAYAQLDVQRTDSTTNPSIRAYNTYASFSGNDLFQTYQVGQGTASSYYHIGCFSTGGAKRFQVRGDGDVTNSNNSYGAISDQNLKENIALSGSQWDDIKALQVKKYSYISEGLDEPNQLGVIAQDLEASGMSGLVENNQALFWHEDEDLPEGVAAGDVKVAEHKSVKYSVLYMKAVKALQEAMNRIETLETTVADLQTRVTALETAE